MHTPGLKVVWPSTAADAAGLLNACLREEDPCLFIESMKLYYGGGEYPALKQKYDPRSRLLDLFAKAVHRK